MDRARSRRLIVAAAGAGLILRLAHGAFYWTAKPLTHDEREYLSLAASIAEGRGFTYSEPQDKGTGQRFGRAPGYPAFLSLFRPDPHAQSAPAAVKTAQAALVALAIFVIAAIARNAAGEEAAVTAAWLAAFYPPLVWIPAYVLSEALFLPVGLACVILLARGDMRSTIIAGLLAGAGILIRPGLLVFLPLAMLWHVRGRQLSFAVAFALAAAVVVLPWTLRNIRVHDRFVLVASEGGVTFWTGNHPLARGEGDLAANPEIKRAEIEFRQPHEGLSAEALEPLYYRDALQRIAERPAWWLALVVKKAFYTFVPIGPSYTLHSTKYLLATVVPYALLAPLAIAGFIVISRSGRPPQFLYLLAASVVLTSLIFFPQERFRIPVLDPLIIVGAAAALAGAVRPTS